MTAPHQGAPRRIGVGVISLGWMGTLHSRSYLAVPSHYPDLGLRPVLAHACDISDHRLDFARDVLGFERAGTSWADVLADPAVDVVSICAPNALHREIAVAAAEAGKPFWIEKPVGRDVVDTAEVVLAAEKAGVLTCVGYNYRHVPAVQYIRSLVAGGELGRVSSVRCVFLNGQAADPRVALSWRFQREHAGSGVLGDLFCHVADLAQYVTADRITELSAAASIVHPRRPIVAMGGSHFDLVTGGPTGPVENEDYAAVLARFGGGAVGTFEVSRVVVGPRSGLVLEVYGSAGSATWDFERMNELRVCLAGSPGYTTVLGNAGLGDYARFQPGPGTAMGHDDLKVIEAARFLAAVSEPAGGEPVAVGRATVVDALSAAEVVAAAVRSADTRRWEQVGS